MRILADENCDRLIVTMLRAERVCNVVGAYSGPRNGYLVVIEASQVRRRSFKQNC